MKRVAPFVALILVLGRAASAFAADPRYPDWPCNQIKVPEPVASRAREALDRMLAIS